MKRLFLVIVIICTTIKCQEVYAQDSSSYSWTEKGAKYFSLELGVDLPQGMPEGYSSSNFTLNGYQGINFIKNLGVELGVGLLMNSTHIESTLENHSRYSNSLGEWFYWTTGEEASNSTSFAYQLLPGIRYTTNGIVFKGSMVFSKLIKSDANTYSTCGNISVGYDILKIGNAALHPSIGYLFGIGKFKDYGSLQFRISLEGLGSFF